MAHFALDWKKDKNNNLIVTLELTNELRLELLERLYPSVNMMSADIHNFPAELATLYDNKKYAARELDRQWRLRMGRTDENSSHWESWTNIEYDVYEPMICNSPLVLDVVDQNYIPLWGGPIISENVETDDNGNFLSASNMWTDEQYAFYDSPAGIDTLIKTGKAVWTLVPSEIIAETSFV